MSILTHSGINWREPAHGADYLVHKAATSRVDWSALREEFPILRERVNGHPLIYFDNAASSQKPRAVLDIVRNYYEHENAFCSIQIERHAAKAGCRSQPRREIISQDLARSARKFALCKIATRGEEGTGRSDEVAFSHGCFRFDRGRALRFTVADQGRC